MIGGNFLINIENTTLPYKLAQRQLLKNSATALRPGGCLVLDFDLWHSPEKIYHSLHKSSSLVYEDDLGTKGRMYCTGEVYNSITQINAGTGYREYKLFNGETFHVPTTWEKYIPTLQEVLMWLDEAGFDVVQQYKNYTLESLSSPLSVDTRRATLIAKKR